MLPSRGTVASAAARPGSTVSCSIEPRPFGASMICPGPAARGAAARVTPPRRTTTPAITHRFQFAMRSPRSRRGFSAESSIAQAETTVDCEEPLPPRGGVGAPPGPHSTQ